MERQHIKTSPDDHSAQEKIELAYGLLWHMRIDRRNPSDKLASASRALLMSIIGRNGQARGIAAAKERMNAPMDETPSGFTEDKWREIRRLWDEVDD